MTSTSYGYNQRVITQLSNETYSFPILGDLFIMPELLIYQNTSTDFMAFVDKVTFRSIYTYTSNGDSLVYAVSVRNDTPKAYDVFACTVSDIYYNNNCAIFYVYGATSPISISLINQYPIQSFCAKKIKMTLNYIVVACPAYNYRKGMINVYARNM